MLGAYLYGTRDLRLVEREPLPLRPSDVRVEVAYSGICGTELHLYQFELCRIGRPLMCPNRVWIQTGVWAQTITD